MRLFRDSCRLHTRTGRGGWLPCCLPKPRNHQKFNRHDRLCKNNKKGSPALLRVATYYEKVVTGGEPELVVVDIEYKDGIYRTHYEQVNEDGTKEAFDDKYKYLVAIDRVRGTSTQVFSSGYMLTNDEDVTYADYASSLSRDPSEWIDAYIIYLLTAVM